MPHISDSSAALKQLVYDRIAGLTITGTPVLVFEGQQIVTQSSKYVRVRFDRLDEQQEGKDASGNRYSFNRWLLVLDLWWPSGKEATSVSAYEIDQAQDALLDGMRYADFPVTAGYALRFSRPPEYLKPPTSAGYRRRLFTLTAHIIAQT